MNTQQRLGRIWLILATIAALVAIVACSARCWGW